MVQNHMTWIDNGDGKGDLYVEYWRKLADLPTQKDVTFTEAVEWTTVFPPRTAVRRPIY
jgi:hypothetical protein